MLGITLRWTSWISYTPSLSMLQKHELSAVSPGPQGSWKRPSQLKQEKISSCLGLCSRHHRKWSLYRGCQYPLNCTCLSISLDVKKNLGLACSWEVNGFGVDPCLFHALQTSSSPSWELFKSAKVSFRYPLTGLAKRSWTCLKTWEQKFTPCFVNLVSLQLVWRLYTVVWLSVFRGFRLFLNSILFAGFNAVPGLSTLDYVTVAVIEKYLDFKVWTALPRTAMSRCKCCVTTQIGASKITLGYDVVRDSFYFKLVIK